MNRFEKDLKYLPVHIRTVDGGDCYEKEQLIYSFKDWQPPKELVGVPQFVADYIKLCRDNEESLSSVIYMCERIWKNNIDDAHTWVHNNEEDFIRAWLDGYTVEKPKENLYVVKLPGVPTLNSYMCKSCSPGELGYNEKYSSKNFNEVRFGLRYYKKYYGGWQRQFTEQEIKAIDEKYWAFAVEVED